MKNPIKKEWGKMNSCERKVAIAEDVLKAISCEIYYPESGTYFNQENFKDWMERGEVLKVLNEPGRKCEVCARGAILMSRLRLGAKDIDSFNPSTTISNSEIDDDTFTPTELASLEAGFECWTPKISEEMGIEIPEFFYNAASARLAESDTKKLTKIMNYIIKHEGDLSKITEIYEKSS